MKPKTAINILRGILPSSEYNRYGNKRKAIDVAVRAIDKQIPKLIDTRPYVYFNGYTVLEDHCPACDRKIIILNGYNYCPYCGQAIDWDD